MVILKGASHLEILLLYNTIAALVDWQGA